MTGLCLYILLQGGHTALCVASVQGTLKAARLLLDCRPNVDQVDKVVPLFETVVAVLSVG